MDATSLALGLALGGATAWAISHFRLKAALAVEAAKRQAAEDRLAEERARLETLGASLKTEFQNLAGETLQTTAQRFTETNRQAIGNLLTPLREHIEAFRKRIDETAARDTDARGRLFQELGNLQRLNTQLTEEAANLARALRGDNKTAGTWGEMILETILAHSGLTEGTEYRRQAPNQNAEGRRIQPDIIIHYPRQEGVLIVDSKVSLKAYTDFCNAGDKPTREQSAAAHLASLKAHICGLANKKYETGQGWTTPEFVLLFLPVDGALSLALNQDPALYPFAFERNIILVTPSTLLTTLKLVGTLWQQDRQNRNVEEIATRGGRLYNKFVTFYENLENIETELQKTAHAFAAAKVELYTGKGNLVWQVQKLKELGANTGKTLPPAVLEEAKATGAPEPTGATEPTGAPEPGPASAPGLPHSNSK